jgi:hypothetical protein
MDRSGSSSGLSPGSWLGNPFRGTTFSRARREGRRSPAPPHVTIHKGACLHLLLPRTNGSYHLTSLPCPHPQAPPQPSGGCAGSNLSWFTACWTLARQYIPCGFRKLDSGTLEFTVYVGGCLELWNRTASHSLLVDRWMLGILESSCIPSTTDRQKEACPR